MDAPNLVVVPPTPLYTSLAASPSPSVSTAPSTPELTQSSDENQRSSSETTMEIYSMYGDDEPSSWPNDSPLKDKRATDVTYRSSARVSREASAYHSTAASSHRTSRTSGPRRTSAVSSTSRASSDAGSPYGGVDNEDMSAALRSILPPAPLVRPSQRHSSLSPPTFTPAPIDGAAEHASPPQSRYLSPSPPHSRPSSSRSHASSAPHAHASSSSARRRSSQGAAPSEHISMASRPPSATTATSTSPRLLQKKRSDLSITPSVGEDPDSFHVRSTYAQLDVLGVKGDGIEEGVERTRARIGTSRESELMATNAIGDEEEKRRDLSPQEIQVLSSLDRYGFFSAPSHDRLVLVPSAALHKPLSRQTRPVTTASTSATSLSKLPPPRPPRREDERMEKWGRMLEPRSRDSGGNIQTWGMNPAKEHKLSRRAFKGIPNRWRSAAWLALLNNYSHTGKEQLQALAQEYREALEKHSAYDIQIDLDVPRTISGHVLFRTRYGLGQRSLFHVLHSFSLRCERCGYCQGMGPIAAMLLCYFAPERAYASLVHLHDAYHMHDIFSPGFPGLLESIYVQERIMEEMMPAVYVAFKKHMISTTSYATKWYITLFANSVPFQTHLRLWDAFLLEGPDLFVIVAIAIIWAYRDHITADAANFETVLSLLSSFFVPEDEDVFLEWISKVAENRKVRSDMEGWRVQWKELVASGRDGDALL